MTPDPSWCLEISLVVLGTMTAWTRTRTTDKADAIMGAHRHGERPNGVPARSAGLRPDGPHGP